MMKMVMNIKPGDLVRLTKRYAWQNVHALPTPDQNNKKVGEVRPDDLMLVIAIKEHRDKMLLGWVQLESLLEATGG